jgi:surface protein
MFYGCTSFNQNLNSWSTTAFVNTAATFYGCTVFNQPMNSWDISNITDTHQMFQAATAFNQDLSSWNTTKVTTMSNMFSVATAFNQDISSWDIRNVTDFTGFMTGKTPSTFSTANLDAIYNGWSSIPVKPSISITFGTAKYTAGGTVSKAILTGAPNNWTIVDGGI